MALDKPILKEAFSLRLKDFEDSIQLVSAAAIDSRYLVTSNLKDLPQKYKDVKVTDLETLIKLI